MRYLIAVGIIIWVAAISFASFNDLKGGVTPPRASLPLGNNLIVTNGTQTTSVIVGNTGVGRTCLWNGTNFTVTLFPANSTTPTITTSTSC